MIYVRSKEGSVLMPTERCGKIGYLLRHGKAHVVSRVPFVVQLDYDSTTYTQDVSLGIDAGSKHIGVSASSEKKEMLAAQVELRSDIVKLLSTRRELRRNRRNRKTRYRKVRFDNRKKKDGWLAPSVEQKIESHLKVIRLVHKLLPITKTTIEVAQFDAQKIKNPDINGEDYQQGEQMGFWNVREYVLARDGHKCVHCKGKSKDPILNVHHLESRKTGGNSPSNLVTLCETCHKAYHRGEFELKIKRGSSLRDAAVMNIMRWAIYERAKLEFGNVHLTYELCAFQKYGEDFLKAQVVRHLNDVATDNRPCNIAIGSYKENYWDMKKVNRDKSLKIAKLSRKRRYDYLDVLEFYNNCHSYKKTKEKFGIKNSASLFYIINRMKIIKDIRVKKRKY